LYNTIEILLECGLVSKHQFGKNQAQFEKSFMFKQHDHLICTDCERVLEFCDPRLQQIQQLASEMLNFDITHHSLNFYGNCQALKQTGRCQYKKTIK
jgi:Fur family ferric uptake transcriptional regulator